ncbi:unnamed protein product [Phytomonas sp. EM1]|nr:unnamed protein product [Phytomonas sp. EM1]|eukprot:CCW62836.1 unnamed protein product [Phytomonas sp. isolate EM1]
MRVSFFVSNSLFIFLMKLCSFGSVVRESGLIRAPIANLSNLTLKIRGGNAFVHMLTSFIYTYIYTSIWVCEWVYYPFSTLPFPSSLIFFFQIYFSLSVSPSPD